ncbi:MAG: GNAT family N-acetyltransferase [Clostridiales bacterium]|nr:GNAT family N-acetyltransferase [Clostridiales bacterium]
MEYQKKWEDMLIMNYELKENILAAKDFIKLRDSAGWGAAPPEHQIEEALKNSLVTISAVFEGRIIGMGRLVGDGMSICYVQEMIIYPEYQGKGIGKAIMDKLISYIIKNGFTNTYVTVGLFSAKGKEGFYSKLGFVERPNEKRGAGMELILKVGDRDD